MFIFKFIVYVLNSHNVIKLLRIMAVLQVCVITLKFTDSNILFFPHIRCPLLHW
jgi:hypothetical protein